MFIDFFKEDGYAVLTTAGYIACAVAVLLIVVLATLFSKPKETAKPHWKAKKLVFSSVCLALAFILPIYSPINCLGVVPSPCSACCLYVLSETGTVCEPALP